MEEPSVKRPRSEPEEPVHSLRYKSISVDLENYGEWVRKLSDDELLSVFELGVKVREAVFFSVDVNREIMDKALASQMKPIHTAVATIEEEVTHRVQTVQESVSRDVNDQMKKMSDVVEQFKVSLANDINSALDPKMKLIQGTMETITEQVNQQVLKVQTNVTDGAFNQMKKMTDSVEDFKRDLRSDILRIQDALTTQVNEVASKVSPLNVLNQSISQSAEVVLSQVTEKISSSEQRLLPAIGACQQGLSKISSSLEVKSSVKGSVGEKLVINILKERFPNFTTVDVSKQRGKGDILIESYRQHKVMIEVKNLGSSNVPQTQIDRFKSDLANCGDVKVGILLSMKSGIANKAPNGKFQVKFGQNKYQIYVPNAGKDENLIVWSVLMADELAAASHGELRTGQVEDLEQLYDEFKSSKEHEKRCRSSLETLEKSANAVKESMECILKTVEKTRNRLKKLLQPDRRDIIAIN